MPTDPSKFSGANHPDAQSESYQTGQPSTTLEDFVTEYVLPELDYDYAALEPHISARIMELHHSKHHAAYVAGANNALEQLAEARDKGDFANINRLSKDLAFHTGGHINHSVFWNNLSPDGGDKPEGELAAAIDDALRLLRRLPRPVQRRGAGPAGLRLGLPGLRAHRRQPGHRAALRPAGQRRRSAPPRC